MNKKRTFDIRLLRKIFLIFFTKSILTREKKELIFRQKYSYLFDKKKQNTEFKRIQFQIT